MFILSASIIAVTNSSAPVSRDWLLHHYSQDKLQLIGEKDSYWWMRSIQNLNQTETLESTHYGL
jgi:hypothetical protein